MLEKDICNHTLHLQMSFVKIALTQVKDNIQFPKPEIVCERKLLLYKREAPDDALGNTIVRNVKNPFQVSDPFLYHLKTSENLWSFDVSGCIEIDH